MYADDGNRGCFLRLVSSASLIRWDFSYTRESPTRPKWVPGEISISEKDRVPTVPMWAGRGVALVIAGRVGILSCIEEK
jgi:hypothetical protein